MSVRTKARPPLLQGRASIPARRFYRMAGIGLRRVAGMWRVLGPGAGRRPAELAARQLRLAFQELGPTFVKFGQLVSASPGTFPRALVEEFSHLQDHVPPEPWEQVATTLEAELGEISRPFRWIDWRPLAAASIAQVYPGTLANGADVVVKVQRAHLTEILRQDLRVLHASAQLVSRVAKPLAATNPVGVVEDFAQSLGGELDFRTEAGHMDRLRSILEGWPVRVPGVYRDLTTRRVLTMERLNGTKMSDTKALARLNVDRVVLADTILGSLLVCALQHGIFHGDGHPGNMLVQDDGTLVLLDFGIVGFLDDDTRILTARLLAAFVEQRFDGVADAVIALSQTPGVDMDAAIADLESIAKEFLSQPLGDIPLAKLLIELVRAANRHGIMVPNDLLLFCKQLLYLDGIGRRLNPGFDVFADGARFVQFLPQDAVGA